MRVEPNRYETVAAGADRGLAGRPQRGRLQLGFLLVLAALAVPLVMQVSADRLDRIGDRYNGDYWIYYESINAGGASFARNGATMLGGSLGQNGAVLVVTNPPLECQSGFWKAEAPCALYVPSISNVVLRTNAMGITFMVVNSNEYEVLYIAEEGGKITAGSHAFTNVVASFRGQGSAGSSTTVWHNIGSATNIGRYYLIKCTHTN